MNASILTRNLRVLGCLAVSALLLVMIYFRLKALPDLKNHYDEAARSLDIMVRNESQGAELSAQLAELERLTSGLQNRLMRIEDKAADSQFFFDIEARSHTKIAELRQLIASPGNGDIRPKLGEFTATGFTVTVSGRIGYMLSFFKRLENAKYFVRCNSVTLRGNPSIAPDAVDVVMKLEVLSKKPQSP